MRCTCLAWHLVPLIRSHLPVRTPPARGGPTYARCSFSSGGRACLRHLSIPSRIVRCHTVLVFHDLWHRWITTFSSSETHFTVFLLEKWDYLPGGRFSWAITIPLERGNNILFDDGIVLQETRVAHEILHPNPISFSKPKHILLCFGSKNEIWLAVSDLMGHPSSLEETISSPFH